MVRGVLGGVIVHEPDERLTARTAALVLQARNVPVADVYAARSIIEPVAARLVAELTTRVSASRELRRLIQDQEDVFHEPERFGRANDRFHERLVALTGNQTLNIVAAMLNEVIARAVTAMAQPAPSDVSTTTRRRELTSQTKLVELIAQGRGDDGGAEFGANPLEGRRTDSCSVEGRHRRSIALPCTAEDRRRPGPRGHPCRTTVGGVVGKAERSGCLARLPGAGWSPEPGYSEEVDSAFRSVAVQADGKILGPGPSDPRSGRS